MPVELGGRHHRGPEVPYETMPAPPALIARTEALVDTVTDLDRVAIRWATEHSTTEDEHQIAVAAFKAGVEYIRQQQFASLDTLRQHPPTATEPLPLEGDATTRTLIAALQFFRTQVLVHDPEEIASGEWLAANQIDGLIEELRSGGRS